MREEPRSGGGAAAGHDAIDVNQAMTDGGTPSIVACGRPEAVVERLLAHDKIVQTGEDERW